MSADSSPLSSPLSSPPPTDDDRDVEDIDLEDLSDVPSNISTPKEMEELSSREPTPKVKRAASPLREKVLADNPDIAVGVLDKKSRFGALEDAILPDQ
jgi:hypothetical protein